MSANASASPAAQFLSSFSRNGDAEPAPDLLPDDEGQEFEIDGERYVIGKKLNQGGFGVIKEAHSITAHGARISLAVKIVRKSIPDRPATENEQAQEALEHEVSVWRHLDHRHVLRLRSVFSNDFATFCLMDLNVGGTLLDAVRKAKRSSISENSGRRGIDVRLAKKYAFQLASALRYLHQDVRVCHRDVKLENCLLDMTVPNAARDGGLLRLCDFGLADFLDSDTSNTNAPSHASIIGTLQYASPRGLSVDRKLYETPGDVWAFGVVVYALCTGDMPFRGGMDAQIVQAIMSEPWPENALKQAAQGSGDEVVIDLVKGCLEKDINDRLTIGEALMSPWFEGCVEDGDNIFC
ncbi:kinase-like protein [Teratosphaeria nubilosa]|uniref:Kinase-like protein n=1 Tax=Teratosphaeria nubilosa TaxID=161662 RepID=A0A6G1LKS2_9PEZI|nr:kinase-like protein [Teratosphaeria nubilosa]